jgi:putative ABC transport system substrate-binding protein
LLAALGGAAAAWPLAARAQQPERMRRIGVLVGFAVDDPVAQRRVLAFAQALAQLGWADGRNVRIDIRWSAGDLERLRLYAGELVALAPDVILASYTPAVLALQRTSRTVPIVFVGVIDAVGSSLVKSLAHPGGNATGFTNLEYGISGKWVELLKQLAPGVKRVAVLRDPTLASGIGQFGAIQAVAPSLGVEVSPVNVRNTSEIERGIAAVARSANGGLIVPAGGGAVRHRDLIIARASQHKLPAIYYDRYFVSAGGLISYGPDLVDQYRQAAGYIDRILKGEKPGNLPVQKPTKYQVVLNLKAAKALGLEVPPAILARADEVIE